MVREIAILSFLLCIAAGAFSLQQNANLDASVRAQWTQIAAAPFFIWIFHRTGFWKPYLRPRDFESLKIFHAKRGTSGCAGFAYFLRSMVVLGTVLTYIASLGCMDLALEASPTIEGLITDIANVWPEGLQVRIRDGILEVDGMKEGKLEIPISRGLLSLLGGRMGVVLEEGDIGLADLSFFLRLHRIFWVEGVSLPDGSLPKVEYFRWAEFQPGNEVQVRWDIDPKVADCIFQDRTSWQDMVQRIGPVPLNGQLADGVVSKVHWSSTLQKYRYTVKFPRWGMGANAPEISHQSCEDSTAEGVCRSEEGSLLAKNKTEDSTVECSVLSLHVHRKRPVFAIDIDDDEESDGPEVFASPNDPYFRRFTSNASDILVVLQEDRFAILDGWSFKHQEYWRLKGVEERPMWQRYSKENLLRFEPFAAMFNTFCREDKNQDMFCNRNMGWEHLKLLREDWPMAAWILSFNVHVAAYASLWIAATLSTVLMRYVMLWMVYYPLAYFACWCCRHVDTPPPSMIQVWIFAVYFSVPVIFFKRICHAYLAVFGGDTLSPTWLRSFLFWVEESDLRVPIVWSALGACLAAHLRTKGLEEERSAQRAAKLERRQQLLQEQEQQRRQQAKEQEQQQQQKKAHEEEQKQQEPEQGPSKKEQEQDEERGKMEEASVREEQISDGNLVGQDQGQQLGSLQEEQANPEPRLHEMSRTQPDQEREQELRCEKPGTGGVQAAQQNESGTNSECPLGTGQELEAAKREEGAMDARTAEEEMLADVPQELVEGKQQLASETSEVKHARLLSETSDREELGGVTSIPPETFAGPTVEDLNGRVPEPDGDFVDKCEMENGEAESQQQERATGSDHPPPTKSNVAGPATAAATEEEPVCRICYLDGDDEPLIAPCQCSGTLRYVHLSCLNSWRVSSPNPTAMSQCDLCKYKYEFRHKMYATILRSALVLLIVSLVLLVGLVFLLAYILRWYYQDEDVVEMGKDTFTKSLQETLGEEVKDLEPLFIFLQRFLNWEIVGLQGWHLLSACCLIGLVGVASLGVVCYPMLHGAFSVDSVFCQVCLVIGFFRALAMIFKGVKSVSSKWFGAAEAIIVEAELDLDLPSPPAAPAASPAVHAEGARQAPAATIGAIDAAVAAATGGAASESHSAASAAGATTAGSGCAAAAVVADVLECSRACASTDATTIRDQGSRGEKEGEDDQEEKRQEENLEDEEEACNLEAPKHGPSGQLHESDIEALHVPGGAATRVQEDSQKQQQQSNSLNCLHSQPERGEERQEEEEEDEED